MHRFVGPPRRFTKQKTRKQKRILQQKFVQSVYCQADRVSRPLITMINVPEIELCPRLRARQTCNNSKYPLSPRNSRKARLPAWRTDAAESKNFKSAVSTWFARWIVSRMCLTEKAGSGFGSESGRTKANVNSASGWDFSCSLGVFTIFVSLSDSDSAKVPRTSDLMKLTR